MTFEECIDDTIENEFITDEQYGFVIYTEIIDDKIVATVEEDYWIKDTPVSKNYDWKDDDNWNYGDVNVELDIRLEYDLMYYKMLSTFEQFKKDVIRDVAREIERAEDRAIDDYEEPERDDYDSWRDYQMERD